MSYLGEAVALETRYRRCRQAWQPHLENTKSLIRQAINACSGHDNAVVLGSGSLLDIPLPELCTQFRHVTLIDVLHPRSARRLIKPFDHVEMIERDITGVSKILASGVTVEDTWPQPVYDGKDLINADLVISANLLSQLPLKPGDCLTRSGCGDQMAIDRFKRRLVDHHLNILDSLSCTVCFVTDVERQLCQGGRIVESEDMLMGAQPLIDEQTWFWDIAPAPEIDRRFDLRHRVVGGVRQMGPN